MRSIPCSALRVAASFFAASVSAGALALGRTEIPAAAQPQLVVANDGRVWLAYGRLGEAPVAAADGQKHTGHQPPSRAGDVFVACSTDGGASFAPAVKVAHVPNLMLGMRRGPRIAAQGDRVTVTYVADELRAVRSVDGGKTWGAPVAVNDVPRSAREGLHDLALAPDGRSFVTWLDLRNGRTELWSAESADGGATWTANAPVYRSPDKTICECCHPTALFDTAGNLAVMWRNAIEGDRDMWLATRPAGSTTFNAAKKLGEGTWTLNACPMDGGRIVALGSGRFSAVWQRAGEIFYSATQGPEVSLGKGKQPVALAQGTGTLVFWQQGTDLVLARHPGAAAPVRVATEARFPVVVSLPQGKGTLLAYEQGPLKEPGVVVQVVP